MLNDPETSEDIKVSIDDLNKLKLIAEIKNLTKPLYKKIEFWQSISAVSIILFTYLFLYLNGFFDTKTQNLEAKRNLLVYDIEKFTKDTVGFTNERERLETVKKNLLSATALIRKNMLVIV